VEIHYQRAPQRVPVTLTAAEVCRLLTAVPHLRERTAMEIAYASGLRLGEVQNLKLPTTADTPVRFPRFHTAANTERDPAATAAGAHPGRVEQVCKVAFASGSAHEYQSSVTWGELWPSCLATQVTGAPLGSMRLAYVWR
jgi:hypothetical protein